MITALCNIIIRTITKKKNSNTIIQFLSAFVLGKNHVMFHSSEFQEDVGMILPHGHVTP